MKTIEINRWTKFKKWFDRSSPVFPTRLSLMICVLLAFGGIIIGFTEQSLAVQTNGLIAAIEIVNSLLFLAAVNQSVRSPDMIFNYGYGKYESLGVLAGTLLLSVILIYTLVEAVQEFGNPQHLGNYYTLLGFSSVSYLVIRQMSKYQRKAADKFMMPMLRYDADVWKIDSYLELGVILNLLFGAFLKYFDAEHVAKIVDSSTAFGLIVFSLKVPLSHGKEALNQLLDKTLPEDIQLDLIAVIAENINRMCEFKSIYTRRSGKDIFIEIDVVMPDDFTLKDAYDFEQDILKSLIDKYPTASPRLYVTPCLGDCIHEDKKLCPVKLAKRLTEN